MHKQKITLLIMAAGLGSRFGGGIKQLEPVGMNGEIIMEYSIHDAIESGFNKLVFVIRKDIENDFRERIGNRVEAVCKKLGVEVRYAYQDLYDIPNGFTVPEGRKKPWGTGHAVLSARDVIREPFAVINADDYYGKEAFRKIHDYLCETKEPLDCCMAGFILKNTLSENGGVTRGICQVDGDHLLDVKETKNIRKTVLGAETNGIILDADCYVSMNMWGFPSKNGTVPAFIELLGREFVRFFVTDVDAEPEKAEYLLPILIGEKLREKELTVKFLETHDKWFGITYKEDVETIREEFYHLIQSGKYEEGLYVDLI